MKPADNINKLFEYSKVTVGPDVDKKILNTAASALPRRTNADKNIWSIIMHNKLTKPLAAAIIIAAGLIFLNTNNATLYAQVKEAFEKAQTFHVIMKEYRDGNWFKDDEIWYDHKAGVREEERYQDCTDIRIDNNEHEWRYQPGSKFVAQIPSYRQDAWTRDLYEWLRYAPERNPDGDKIINGVLCEMYTHTDSENSQKLSVWVNKQHRVLEFEQEEQKDGQNIRIIATIEYDIDMNQNLFEANIAPNVKIVGPRELIEKEFPLETAIYKHESLGFVFAVHELKLGDDFKYLVCSNRLTQETRKEIGTNHPWTYYGEADLFGRYNKSGDYINTSDEPILLAQMRHDGIQVEWYALVPTGSKAKQNGCDLDVHVSTANELSKKLNSQGLPIRDKFRLNLTLEEADKQSPPLSEICGEIFAFGEEFGPIVHVFVLTNIVTEADGNRVLAWKKPRTELLEEDFIKDVESRVEYYLDSNR